MLAGRRAQVWHYQPAYRRPKHFHEESEINLITRGRGTIQLGEREVEVRAGSLVWFPPGLDHYLATASEDFELLTTGFQPELLEAFKREHSRTFSFARPWQQLNENQALKVAIVLGQTHEATDPQSVELRSLEVLRTLSRLSTTGASHLGHRAASFIVAHPTISRDRLAQAVRSNRGDISRRFHRDHGMTLRQYRNVLRTLHFIRLNNGGTCTLAGAAVHAGFGSYSQCHRVIRSLFGISPRELAAKRPQFSSEDEFKPLSEFLVTEAHADDELPTVADGPAQR
jgi:AraC-like DNA-binding protein